MGITNEIFMLFLSLSIVVVIGDHVCPSNFQNALTECSSKATKNSDWSGVLLCAYDYIYKCQANVEGTHENLVDEYDITINPNWTFLRKLGEEGWPIKLGNKLKSKTDKCQQINQCNDDEDCLLNIPPKQRQQCVEEAVDISGCFVAWMGGFNVGKTFLLNKVTGHTFVSSYGVKGETKGVNFILPDPNAEEELIHIDNPGVLRSVQPEQLQDRHMTDRFIEDLMPDIATRIVLVVDILTSQEQVLISRLMTKIAAFSTSEHPKQLYVLHNFKNLGTNKEVEFHIETDIIRAFKAEPKPKQNPKYWQHKDKGMKVYHFVFAAEYSKAGETWNKKSLKKLKSYLEGPCNEDHMQVLGHFLNKLTPLMREYFPPDINPDPLGINGTFNVWDLLTRAKNWVGAFFQIIEPKLEPEMKKILPPKTDDPFQVQFEIGDSNDIKNRFDGKIVLRKKRELAYCKYTTTGNILERPQCHPEPDCVLLNGPEQTIIWILQCKLPNQETSNFSDLKEKWMLKIEDSKTPAQLKIFGTILPPWKDHVDNYPQLELQYADQKMFGWFSKTFILPTTAVRYYEKKVTKYHDGIFTVMIPLSDGIANSIKEEL